MSSTDHCQSNSLVSCTCRRSRSELNQEQVRRTELGRKNNNNDNLAEFCSNPNPLEFFCHFSPTIQKWCCTDCNHPIADHFEKSTSNTEKQQKVPELLPSSTNNNTNLMTFNKGDHVWNKVSKCFSTVVDVSSNVSRASPIVMIRCVNFMKDSPFWKPFSERRVESCEMPCVTHSSLFTTQQKQDLERMLVEEAEVEERTKKGIRVCPQPPCAVCGHYFCYDTVGEDPSDLGGWSVVCCPVNSKTCECKFCVWKNSTRRPIEGANGCCQCAKKAHERR